MSNDKSESKEPISERRQSTSGIKSGGRRKADRGLIEPKGKKARMWMAASFILSGLIIAWAFSLPFRKGGFSGSKSKAAPGETIDVRLVNSDDPYERVSKEEYVEELMARERELMDQVRAVNNRRVKNPPTEFEIKRKLAQRGKKMKAEAEMLAEMIDYDFKQPTVEREAIDAIRKVLEDTGE